MTRLALRAAAAFRINLNWAFDPATAWTRREPLFLKTNRLP